MFSTSSSLAASDHELPRHDGSGFIKNGKIRHSKQHMTEKKMFGSRFGKHGKDFHIGMKFRKKGKDTGMKGMKNLSAEKYHSMGNKTGMHIGPSEVELDHMMSKKRESVTHDMNKKKSLFSRKHFG